MVSDVDDKALATTGWVMRPATVQQRMSEIAQYKAVMMEGEDFGTIPGTQKPTLYQPGADTLCQAADLATGKPEFIEKVEDWTTPFFYYLVSLAVMNADGRVLAVGVGSCNSKESKYASRWVPFFTLDEEDKARSKAEAWKTETRTSKKGKDYLAVFAPSSDIYDQVNTLQKMAVKRAYISAVLRATGATRVFTQDIEDMSNVVDGEVREVQQPAPRSAPDQKAAGNGDPNKARHDLKTTLDAKYPDEQERWQWMEQNAPTGTRGTNVAIGDMSDAEVDEALAALGNAD
ncbi:hypothetical protein LCGC14_2501710 [marine sediment metagenome]|uniref:Uncharacterized protein n=1 Tax=marine sediment metagenome TaxID=412755 RepID=A0A0F9BPP9_9ZZZZ